MPREIVITRKRTFLFLDASIRPSASLSPFIDRLMTCILSRLSLRAIPSSASTEDLPPITRAKKAKTTTAAERAIADSSPEIIPGRSPARTTAAKKRIDMDIRSIILASTRVAAPSARLFLWIFFSK